MLRDTPRQVRFRVALERHQFVFNIHITEEEKERG